MNQRLVSIKAIARDHGKNDRSLRKLVKRLRIDVIKERAEDSRGQLVSHIRESDYEELKRYLDDLKSYNDDGPTDDSSGVSDVFYLVLLEPEYDPGRFKVGFTTNINERMRSHKTAAPFAKLKDTWPCRPLWERTAIECVTQGCHPLYTEVFRTDDIGEVIDHANQFFNLMPLVD